MNAIGHTHARAEAWALLSCKILSKNTHCTSAATPHPNTTEPTVKNAVHRTRLGPLLVAKGGWLLRREEHRMRSPPAWPYWSRCWLLRRIGCQGGISTVRVRHRPDLIGPADRIWPTSPHVPSVFERNLQYQPVRGVDSREECHWSHACKSFKRTCVGSNGILE
jgi:hypothetical protein